MLSISFSTLLAEYVAVGIELGRCQRGKTVFLMFGETVLIFQFSSEASIGMR
jgi:hypothetical protein